MTCAPAVAADTAGPGCAAWWSGFSVRGSEVARQEQQWRCAKGSQWPHFPRCPSLRPTVKLSAHPVHPAGKEPRPAGSSGRHGVSEAASGNGGSDIHAHENTLNTTEAGWVGEATLLGWWAYPGRAPCHLQVHRPQFLNCRYQT